MRKLISKQKQEKKQKRITAIMSGILVLVLCLSVFGIMTSSFGKNQPQKQTEYNGYNFILQDNLWYTSIGELNFAFQYLPNQTNYSNTTLKKLNNYKDQPLYLYSEDYNSEVEIYRNINQIIERLQPACLNKEECKGDFPIINCEKNSIIIKLSNNTKINQIENCVYIQGKRENLTQLTDEFLFRIIGIK